LAAPTTAVVVGGLTALLLAAEVPLSERAHSGVLSNVANPFPLAFLIVGVLVARTRPRNPIGWILLAAAVLSVLQGAAALYSVVDYRDHGGLPGGPVAVLLEPSWAPAIVLFAVAIQLFPDGHLAMRRGRWFLWIFGAVAAAWVGGAYILAASHVIEHNVHVTSSGDLVQVDNPTGSAAWWGYVQIVFFPLFGVNLVLWLASQVPVWRHATGVRREQMKCLMGGATIAVIGGGLTITLSGQPGFLGVIASAGALGLAALPVSVGIGITRYRLYEVDRLISRTLSYAILTALLVGVFVGIVVLTSTVLPLGSPVAVTASTLAAAALFNPLRLRVQRLVDRRFNRARYDAEATVAVFTARLRDAIDLDTVQAELAAAVDRAVQPTHLSTWIRPAEQQPR
jgi:MFS family permease